MATNIAKAMNLSGELSISNIEQNEILPDFDESGMLPPWAGDLTDAKQRHVSPYNISMKTFRDKFAWDEKRKSVVDSLDLYLNDLNAVGVDISFIWIGGSFVERRPARDLDVIVFCYVHHEFENSDSMRAFADDRPELFDKESIKRAYGIDAGFVILSNPPERIIKLSIYWGRIFSSCRNNTRAKGYVEIAKQQSSERW